MRLFLICMAVLLGVSSCTTTNKVYSWLDKNKVKAAQYCALEFPVREVIKEGETVVKVDTQYIAGDTVECPPDSLGNSVKIPCPETKVVYSVSTRVDTQVVKDWNELELQRLKYLESQEELASVKGQLVAEKVKVEDLKQKTKRQSRINLALWLVIGMYVLYKVYGFISLRKKIF